MKKVTGVLFAVWLSWAFSAQAVVQITWVSTDGNEVLQQDLTPAPATWTAQLIWTSDGNRDAVDPNNPFVPSDDDVVLQTNRLNDGGVGNGPGDIRRGTDQYGDQFIGGFVYTRVFNAEFGNPGSLATMFGESGNITGPLLQFSQFNPNSFHFHSPQGIIVSQAVVPEASTWALLGVGALVFGLRRLRQRHRDQN